MSLGAHALSKAAGSRETGLSGGPLPSTQTPSRAGGETYFPWGEETTGTQGQATSLVTLDMAGKPFSWGQVPVQRILGSSGSMGR